MKKFISVLLIFTLCFGMVPLLGASAQTTALNSEVTAQGSDSFTNMLANAVEEKALEQQSNNGYNIFSVTFEGTVATVSLETLRNATVVVALYDNFEETKLLRSGYLDVTPDDRQVEVPIQTTILPVYFIARVYLVDPQTLAPLCPVFENRNYTYEMESFFKKTVADFPQETVLNFDEDTTNNFAVFREGVVLLREGTHGRLVVENPTQMEYTFLDAQQPLTTLTPGEIFSFCKTDGSVLIVKIKSISVNQGRVTVTGEDAEFIEIFSYIKLDTAAGLGQAQIDSSTCGDGVVFQGPVGGAATFASRDFNEDLKDEFSLGFEFEGIENLKGSALFQVSTLCKLYLSEDYEYFELKFDYKLHVALTLEGKLQQDIPLAYVAFSPVPGMYISIEPSFTVKAESKLEISGELTGTFGGSNSSDTGKRNLSSSPQFMAGVKGEVSLFIGVSLNPKVSIICEKIAKVEVNASAGVKITGKPLEKTTEQKEYIHECNYCIDGDLGAHLDFQLETALFNSEKFKFVIKYELDEKFADFYWSADYNEFDFTECPHILYKVTVKTTDQSKTPLEGVKVTLTATEEYTSDNNGTCVVYLPNGSYLVEGEKEVLKGKFRFTVMGDTKEVPLTLRAYGTGATQVSAGECHSAALSEDGSLYLWGSDAYGQLGNGSGEENWEIPQVLMENVVSMDMGPHCSGAITADGALYTWGWNINGQLGTGDTVSVSSPNRIMGDVKQIAFGGSHAAAVTNTGDLYTWGGNGVGQCGDGKNYTSHYTPKYIMSNVEWVDLGTNHTLIVTSDGSLYATGGNNYGQLGTGDKKSVTKPVKVMDGVAYVQAGDYYSAVLTTDGTVYTFGLGKLGRLGNGSDDEQLTPSPILSSVSQLMGGDTYCSAITTNGTLYMWGGNGYGQLGTGNYNDHRYVPYRVMEDVMTVAVNSQHTIAVTNDGSVYTWGDDRWGELGNGEGKGKSYVPQMIVLPIDMEEASDAVAQVAAGSTTQTTDYAGLVPGRIYNFYVMASPALPNAFDVTNLAYIAQGQADASGNLSFTYTTRSVAGATETVLVEQYSGDIAYGDVNSDTKVDAKDALLVLRIAVNKYTPDATQKLAADVTGDGNINAKDALEILKKAVGKPACF